MSGEGPYRDGKRLAGLIAPDRRRQHAVILIGGGMVAGAVLLHVVGRVSDAPPAPAETPSAPVVVTSLTASPPPPLGEAEVERVVHDHAADLRRTCWASDRPPGLAAGALSLTLTITPSGAVESVVPEPSSDPESAAALLVLEECVGREVRGWQFRRSEKGATVRIPLRFESR